MKKIAVILAGGTGSRAGGDIPKQFQPLAGMPVAWHSVLAFHRENPDTEIIVVVHPEYVNKWDEIISSMPHEQQIAHTVIAGGKSRYQSVKNALTAINDFENALVAIHDGARPLVAEETIRRGWDTAACGYGAVPVVPVTDSLRIVGADSSKSTDRSLYRAVQTPQIFSLNAIKKAYSGIEKPIYTDDASVAEDHGISIRLYDGQTDNIKITNPSDFVIAETLLKLRTDAQS